MTPASPTPAEIDELAEEFLALKKQSDDAWQAAAAASKPCEEMADRLKQMVGQFGQQHAEKSRLLHGLEYELMTTTGVITKCDQKSVEVFRAELIKQKMGAMFKNLFDTVITYKPLATASDVVRSGKLTMKLIALHAQCTITEAKSPSLKVREKAA